jgi:hypothetical protein
LNSISREFSWRAALHRTNLAASFIYLYDM